MILLHSVPGEPPCGKSPLVKLPRCKSPQGEPLGEKLPLFINVFFMYHSIKIKRKY